MFPATQVGWTSMFLYLEIIFHISILPSYVSCFKQANAISLHTYYVINREN